MHTLGQETKFFWKTARHFRLTAVSDLEADAASDDLQMIVDATQNSKLRHRAQEALATNRSATIRQKHGT